MTEATGQVEASAGPGPATDPTPGEVPRETGPGAGRSRLPLRATLVYLVAGLAWIAGSDLVVSLLVPQGARTLVQSYKGVLFVLVTAGVFYRLLSTQLAHLDRLESNLRAAEHREARRRQESDQALALLSATEHLQESVVMTDSEQRILYVNAAFERLSGYSREEVLGQTPKLVRSGLHTEDFYASMYARLASGSPWTGTFRNRRKDGSLWNEIATIAPVTAGDRVTHYVKVSRDVTGQDELDRRMRDHQKLEAIGTLAAGIAHEFNNLLGMILGYAELVADALPEEAPSQKDLDRIVTAADRGSELVRQLLTFSRGTEGSKQRIPLQPLVAETAKFLRSSLPAGIDLVVELGAPGVEVEADPSQIRQALVNLVTNSGQALPQGSGRIRISLSLPAKDPDEIVLLVEDDGVGIPAELLGRVTEPFFTTRPPGEGSGLGLSVVHGVVTAMGGALEIESQTGKGTRVRLRLPRAVDSQPAAPPKGEVSVAKGRRIVVVEDEAMLLETTRRTLETFGMTVETFRDPCEAVRRMEDAAADFDVLVTDLSMPGMNGIEVARAFKSRWPTRPTVMVTGFGDRDVAGRAAGDVVDRLLRKPVRRSQLAQVLGELIRGVREPSG